MPVHWTHPGLDSPEDSAERRRVEARMDDFWREFAASHAQIAGVFNGTSEMDIPGWMRRWLDPVSAEIMWEFGPPVRGDGHRLVLTSESEHGLRPLVDAFLARAPQLAGWEFFGWRLRETWQATVRHVQSRTGVSLEGATFRTTPGIHGLLDVDVAAPSFSHISDDDAFAAAVLAVEQLAGEKDLNVWVGGIGAEAVARSEFDPKTAQEDGWRDMSELPGVLDEHKESYGKSLESRSFADVVEGAEWVLWELKPIKRAEYARQLDLFVGKSGLREIWEATHGGRFFEERFVANGETLAYVKLDGRGDIESEKFEDKASIEDALDEALRADDLGAFIGGGTGLAYSYIDVVLTDVVRGVETIRRVLANGNVNRRCWILFEDAHLEREWVPLYADSPLPPTEEESEPLEAPT